MLYAIAMLSIDRKQAACLIYLDVQVVGSSFFIIVIKKNSFYLIKRFFVHLFKKPASSEQRVKIFSPFISRELNHEQQSIPTCMLE